MNKLTRIFALVNCAIFASLMILNYSSYGANGREKGFSEVPNKTIEQVLKNNASKWMNIQGVEGVAIGLCDDEPCIKVFTSVKPEEIEASIPDSVDGYPVVIEFSGSFCPLN